VGAVGDIVDHGVNGIICRPDDAEDLANAVSHLVGCEVKRRQFGAASRERFERLFSNDMFRHNLGEVFREAGLK
jgi:glycosyltransferase involved in cell wall biosynthesis